MLTRRNFASNFVQIAYIASAIEGNKVVIQVRLSVSNNNLNLICYGFVQKIVAKQRNLKLNMLFKITIREKMRI